MKGTNEKNDKGKLTGDRTLDPLKPTKEWRGRNGEL